jgi:transposase
VVTCPAGKQSISWLPNTWPENGMQFEARFARKDCTPCSLRPRCTRAKNEPRIIGLQAREHYEALQSARQHQTTKEFQQRYAARSGIEATHAQAISRCRWPLDPGTEFATSVNIRGTRCKVPVRRSELPWRGDV